MSRTAHASRRCARRRSAFVDERLGAARGVRFLMDYVFPDHWSFLLGEIALYSFVVLVAHRHVPGAVLRPEHHARPSTTAATSALQGQSVSAAYARRCTSPSTCPGGLLMRQTHHWAALVFVAAITLHLLRIVFTGAFRKPRDINYFIGVTLLAARDPRGLRRLLAARRPALGDGPRDRLGRRDVTPAVGGPFATALWGGRFPGSTAFESRLYIAHVFVHPGAPRRR